MSFMDVMYGPLSAYGVNSVVAADNAAAAASAQQAAAYNQQQQADLQSSTQQLNNLYGPAGFGNPGYFQIASYPSFGEPSGPGSLPAAINSPAPAPAPFFGGGGGGGFDPAANAYGSGAGSLYDYGGGGGFTGTDPTSGMPIGSMFGGGGQALNMPSMQDLLGYNPQQYSQPSFTPPASQPDTSGIYGGIFNGQFSPSFDNRFSAAPAVNPYSAFGGMYGSPTDTSSYYGFGGAPGGGFTGTDPTSGMPIGSMFGGGGYSPFTDPNSYPGMFNPNTYNAGPSFPYQPGGFSSQAQDGGGGGYNTQQSLNYPFFGGGGFTGTDPTSGMPIGSMFGGFGGFGGGGFTGTDPATGMPIGSMFGFGGGGGGGGGGGSGDVFSSGAQPTPYPFAQDIWGGNMALQALDQAQFGGGGGFGYDPATGQPLTSNVFGADWGGGGNTLTPSDRAATPPPAAPLSDQTTGQAPSTPPPAYQPPAWMQTIPTAQRNDDVTNAITSGMGDPAATAQLIYRESNWGQNPGTVGGNYGAGQMAPDDFKLSGGTLDGMTYDQYVKAPLAAQIGAYNDFFNGFQTRNPGLDISQYDAATQYAIRQAANYTPWNPSAWLPSFLAGNSNVPVTSKDQGGDIGIPTINSLIAIARSRGL